jgi:hypothetical protein
MAEETENMLPEVTSSHIAAAADRKALSLQKEELLRAESELAIDDNYLQRLTYELKMHGLTTESTTLTTLTS